ncbi:flagellar export protein FliJ [bacterium]|nr:MAG: flagellar export protein FliJ [bacterium]
MKRFTFSLQPVLDVRERRERERMQRLAQAQLELQQAQERLEELDRERQGETRVVRERHSQLELEELQAYYAHLEHLAAESACQRERVAEAQRRVETSRTELIAASTDKRVVERLKERRHEDFLHEERLAEQRQVDDDNARVESRVRERGKT